MTTEHIEYVGPQCAASPFWSTVTQLGEIAPVLSAKLVGSVYISGCGEDIDVAALIPGHLSVDFSLERLGWDRSSEVYAERDSWASWRKGNVNLLVHTDPDYFDKFSAAADCCRYLVGRGLSLDKSARVAVHQIVQDGLRIKEW